jgi:hypothetical protein
MTIDERRVLATQNTPWDSQVAELKRRLDLQQTDAEIAAALGRTERAVAIKRHKLGLIAYNLPVPSLATRPTTALIAELELRGYSVTKDAHR